MTESNQRVVKQEDNRPRCHNTPMSLEFGDDGCMQVAFWVCPQCGHTKEIDRTLAG